MAVTHKERSTFSLGSFKGVDFSTSPFNVSAERAVQMENMINVDGVNQKRPGWSAVFNLDSGRINGMFYLETGTSEILLVHAKRAVYAYDFKTGEILSSTSQKAIGIPDSQSQFFCNNGNVFVICGELVVYKIEENEFYRIDKHPDVYIPTTTIFSQAITPRDNSNNNLISSCGASFEAVNLLTRRRKNTFFFTKEDKGNWVCLDGRIDYQSTVSLSLPYGNGEYILNFVNASENELRDKWGKENFENAAGNNYKNRVASWFKCFIVAKEYADGQAGRNHIFGFITNRREVSAESCNLYRGVLELGDICDDYATYVDENHPAIIEFESTAADVASNDDLEELSRRVRTCRIGARFGVNGNDNRLFLSGGDIQKNAIYSSGLYNFLYFPDIQCVTVGSSDNPVMGMLRIGDSSMAVFKDGKDGDSTVYYITCEAYTKYEDNQLVEDEFQTYVHSGGSAEPCISHFAGANLVGDSLMLTKSGVYAITQPSNSTTGVRYVKERSFNINERLKKHKDLSEATATVYNNRYYLSADGVCYVADPRFKFYRDEQMDQSFNYEWWYWTGVDARCFCLIKDELFFGTNGGSICKFKENSYTDDTFVELKLAELLVDNDDIVFNKQYSQYISDGDIFELTCSAPLYYYIASCECTDERTKFSTSYGELCRLNEGDLVGVGLIQSDGTFKDGRNERFFVGDIDLAECTFSLYCEDTRNLVNKDDISQMDGVFKLYDTANGKSFVIAEKKEGSFKLKYSDTGPLIDVAPYQISQSYTAKITHRKNVVSKWVTPYFDMGSNVYSKTLLGITLCTFTSVGERIKFGYQVKNGMQLMNNKGGGEFDLDNTAFDSFSFDTTFADSYTKKLNVRNFNYIRFAFLSDSPHNCAVNNLTAFYKINKINRGVR